MKWRKFMHNCFAANNEAWSGVTSMSGLTSDLYYHYSKLSAHWKLSGETLATASKPIFTDSDTTSIVVTPATTYQYSGLTRQLVVVNQDAVDVITECLFDSGDSTVCTVNTAGLVTIVYTGTTIITVTHNDGPTGTTTVIGYWPGPVTITPLTATGITGTTLQFTLTSATGKNLTTLASWSSSTSGVTIGAATGLATIAAHAGSTANITATYGTLTGTPYAPVRTLTITGS